VSSCGLLAAYDVIIDIRELSGAIILQKPKYLNWDMRFPRRFLVKHVQKRYTPKPQTKLQP
jgi:hypothetical protein